MNTRMKACIAGVGSAVAVYPSISYSHFVPHANAEERIRDCREKTGRQLRQAITEYDEDQQHASKKQA